MLRISGADLDIDSLLAATSLVPEISYRKGETRRNGTIHERSGAAFLVSAADFDDFEAQKNGALIILTERHDAIRTLMQFPGVDGGCLDFGILRRDTVVQCDFFPPELLKLAGELGLGIELSQYPCNTDDEEPTTAST